MLSNASNILQSYNLIALIFLLMAIYFKFGVSITQGFEHEQESDSRAGKQSKFILAHPSEGDTKLL
ncbi:hypothetical protein GCM10027443_15840 [Pontibacter brevis]